MKTAVIIRQVLALCLILTAFLVTVPISNAEEYNDMSVSEIMEKFDSRVRAPKSTSVLAQPETAYVKSTYGNSIYVFNIPNGNGRLLFRANEGATVTVYARESGFALGLVEGTSIGGWMSEYFLAESYNWDAPGPHDTEGLWKEIRRPIRNEYLPDYETMYVKSKHGICIYMFSDPDEVPLNVIDKIPEAEKCILIARRNSMYFVITEHGQRGWVNASQLVDDY